jgi:hypothetical protein
VTAKQVLSVLAAALVSMSGRLLAQHEAHRPLPGTPLGIVEGRVGSGTTWLPDSSAHQMRRFARGTWTIDLHGAVIVHYLNQGTKRGAVEFGVTDWEMLSASRSVAGGLLRLRAMTSLEPLSLGGSGYALLLQTGGTWRHSPLHDRQHPHSAVGEASVAYERSLSADVALSLYAAPVGEPALGPVSYRHRPSASVDPTAPLSLHWQDASHQSFGVVTAGLYGRAIRIEGSAFNAREPDETHPVADFRDARLDSYAGRISWAPSGRVVASGWWGYLGAHGRLDLTTRMHRYGASVLSELPGPGGGRWTSAAIWGVNVHHHGAASHAVIHGGANGSPHQKSSSVLLESTLDVDSATSLFTRIERVEKNGEELGFLGGDLSVLYDVRAVALGVSRRVASARGAELTLGVRGTLNLVPKSLEATYGTRRPLGMVLFSQLRPRGR